MLRSVLSRTSSVALAGSRRANGTHLNFTNPSTTTSVLLTRLPTTVVENELKTALADVKCRKIELEPGCSLHFASECEAKIAAKSIETKFGTQVARCTPPFQCAKGNLIYNCYFITVFCLSSLDALPASAKYSRGYLC